MPPTLWYYEHEGKSGGPVTVSQLRQLAATGDLLATDKVRKDDMTKWVKARAVKGLFAPQAGESGDVLTSPSTVEGEGEIETGASAFDFFGAGGPAPPVAERTEDNTVFDFFNPAPAAAPSPAAGPLTVPPITTDDVPVAKPAPSILDPLEAMGDLGSVSGSAVDLLPDGGVALTGGRTTLRLTGRWLMAKTSGTGGPDRLACLRLSKLEAAFLGGRPEMGPKGARRGTQMVLSFHVGGQSVAVACAEGDKTCATFLEKVLRQKG